MPLALAYDELRRSQMHVVVTGSAHLGLPLAVLKKPFIAWVATAYEDEIEGRVAVGDSWAQSLIGGSQWPKLQAQERQVIEAASLVLALSPNTARRLKEIAPNAADKIRTLLCPVDTDSFRPANDGAQAAANPIGSPYLLLTARIRDPRKNAHMLLRAFAGVRAAYPDLKLVFIGDAPFDSHLAVRDELGLGDSVIFLPPKSHSEIIRYYQAAELFTLSSTQEGLAISMLEALACGLPVIATRCGGPEGILQDSPTGRLVPNNDPHAFADAILETLADKPKLASMRATARKFALDNFARPIVQAQLRLAFGEVYPQYFENNHQ
jgi:glycosyltransferase involved in cell wall biosynthesis